MCRKNRKRLWYERMIIFFHNIQIQWNLQYIKTYYLNILLQNNPKVVLSEYYIFLFYYYVIFKLLW